MKITKTKLAAASFGAALTSMYSAPELSAQVVDLTFTPSIVPNYVSGGLRSNPVVFGIPTSNGVRDISFNFFNDAVGRTFTGPPSAFSFGLVDPGDVFSGIRIFTTSSFLPASVFLANGRRGIETFGFLSVSYTHLTLPTIYSV